MSTEPEETAAEVDPSIWLERLLTSEVWAEMKRWLQKNRPQCLLGKSAISDIIQSAYIAAHQNLDDCNAATPQERDNWFRSIVRNKLREKVRKYRAQRRHVDREVATPLEHTHEQSPASEVLRDEVCQIVRQALSRLKAEHCEVVCLRFRDNMTRSEIAEHLNISPGAVANRMRKALSLLRQDLDPIS